MAFCRLPWQGLMITPLGDFRVCALTNSQAMNEGMALDEDGKLMNIMTHTPNQGINGKWHRKIRLHDVQNNDAWHDICSCCTAREVATGGDPRHPSASRRQSMEWRVNAKTEVLGPNTYKNFDMDANGYVKWNPTNLDIRFGNLCNQKCVHCSPSYSNLWYEDWVGFNNNNLEVPWGFGHNKIKLERNEHGKLFNPEEVRWWESPVWWSKFEELMPTLRHIYITGGEPMIVPAHDEMLDRLIASGYAKNVHLEYDTNLSVINNKLAERWNHFRHVEIAASVDAIGKPFELIRSANWEKFAENVAKVKEFEKGGVVKLNRITTCSQISTTHTMFETEQWVRAQGDVNFTVRFVDSPAMHSWYSLPNSAKQELLDYYSTIDTFTSRYIRTWLQNAIAKNVVDITAIHKYVKMMDYLDTTRGTNWRETIPETLNLLNKHVPSIKLLEKT
jgi:MoaA/NifB/PqqE/SkfB family radical SAM enzyme